MNYRLKMIFAILVLGVYFKVGYSQPATHKIELRLDSNKKLIDPGTIRVDRGDYITWIKIGDDFQWFHLIGTRGPIPDPPQGNFGRFGSRVRRDADSGIWKYNIKYKARNEPADTLDPKIAVNPLPSPISKFVYLIGFMILAVLSIFFYKKWRKVKLEPQKNK